ncbi:2-oxo-4-hydroxy-4-carboxy-5-ureidoimidazoline decarboxylase [Spirulina subsalsa FACHB-351]|uniref:2-oxo-4-hydroxy-4-carboxy-5-ureidoimidazoline decarboxylase n=1 Tax=Spirulina subsalsa FACHB-351 TaxID=234711 RepID=A0ABT3L2X3_9CYAN|nr:2-oxo-4-hydroxy-4-carboxy-5-ureidoimidazoline decarboxylase [Spirulina subsalsa]MCW6035854.1 2-oxo-4-hydroxy-4-carboxy-5-ureidoimidazoline decarboxylase [Spirulina subsalsa FACHB-351]
MLSIAELNSMEHEAFMATVGHIFENTPELMEQVAQERPFLDFADLYAKMTQGVANLNTEAQLALIRAHPDLGTKAKIGQFSTLEQKSAGLDQLTVTEFEEFHRLNGAYKQRFGFPFVMAVKGKTAGEIRDQLRLRLGCSLEEERQEAIAQILKIAQFRLQDLIQP